MGQSTSRNPFIPYLVSNNTPNSNNNNNNSNNNNNNNNNIISFGKKLIQTRDACRIWRRYVPVERKVLGAGITQLQAEVLEAYKTMFPTVSDACIYEIHIDSQMDFGGFLEYLVNISSVLPLALGASITSPPSVWQSDMPAELLVRIFSYLDPGRDAQNAASTCRSWSKIAECDYMWMLRYQYHFGIDGCLGCSSGEWKSHSFKAYRTLQISGDASMWTVALTNGYDVVVQRLLLADPSLLNLSSADGPPLFVAAKNGHANVVQRLIDAQANVAQTFAQLMTPLYVAAKANHVVVANKLIAAGADINMPVSSGATPLAIASQVGATEVVQALITAGANVNQPDNSGATSLYRAAYRGHKDVVALLLKASANVNQYQTKSGGTPFYMACQEAHLEVMELLLKANADVNAALKTNSTPLAIACHKGHRDVVRFLLQTPANINARHNSSGGTPLYFAARKGHIEIVLQLIEAKADVNSIATISNRTAGTYRVTPLDIALENNFIPVAEALIAANGVQAVNLPAQQADER